MTRVASAAVLVGIVAFTVWGLPWWATVAAAAIVAWLAADELAAMAARVGAAIPMRPLIGLSAALISVALVLDGPAVPWSQAGALAGTLMGVWLAAGVVGLAAGPPSPATFTRIGVAALAPLYVGLPLGALAWIRTAHGAEALSWLVLVIASSDSAQYYTGRAFGTRKLAPAVSPAKTVEGALGGLIAAAVVAAVAARWWLPGTPAASAGLFGLMLAAIGIAGDLFESLIKRSVGVKDSSSLIPGHGGVLDRIDSYLFASPLCYLVLRHVA